MTDPIFKAIKKFEKHPSILKIKEHIYIEKEFKFSTKTNTDIESVVYKLDVSRANTHKGIPTKIFKDNFDIYKPLITNIYNESIAKAKFPSTMKLADITPVHKKKESTNKKTNYRPVSILSLT